MATNMALRRRNCQGISKSGGCVPTDVFSNSDVLEEILVRVPPEYISTPMLVAKGWFGLIRSSSFREHYTRRWSHALHLVGFKGFYVRANQFFRTPLSQEDAIEACQRKKMYDWGYAHRFLSTCKEGNNDLIFGRDDYLIDSSSNGILLIGRQSYPFTFIVYNPFTKKHYQLPQPRENYQYGCMAFEVEYYGKGSFHYKVTRAKCDMHSGALDAIPIQTFSSKTGRWDEVTLPSSKDLRLNPRTTGTVIGGVIHWLLANGGVAIYDGKQQLAYIRNPDTGTPCMGGIKTYMFRGLGESADRRLQCAHTWDTDMKIWVLETDKSNYSNYTWSVRYKVDFEMLRNKNMGLCQAADYDCDFLWISFVPRNSEYGFISLDGEVFLLHIPSETLERISYEDELGSSADWYKLARGVKPYFKWACPWPNLATNTSL